MKSVIAVAVLVAGLVAASKGYGGLLVAALVVALLLGGGVKVATSRTVAGHAHGGTRARIATHEAGHVVAARAVGGRVLDARMSNHDGYVSWDMSHRDLAEEVASNLTFLKAGEIAAGSGEGCGSDRAAYRQELRRLPSNVRGKVRSHAESHARRIVRSRQGEIRKVAEKMNRDGRL